METGNTIYYTKEKIKKDLEYWSKKKEHFEKTNNPVGVRVAKLLIDKYLDIYNDTIT
jgi:hypothetical protein